MYIIIGDNLACYNHIRAFYSGHKCCTIYYYITITMKHKQWSHEWIQCTIQSKEKIALLEYGFFVINQFNCIFIQIFCKLQTLLNWMCVSVHTIGSDKIMPYVTTYGWNTSEIALWCIFNVFNVKLALDFWKFGHPPCSATPPKFIGLMALDIWDLVALWP